MPLEPVEDFLKRNVPSARSKRAQQKAIRRLRLPKIKVGRASMIDTDAGEQRLRDQAMFSEKAEEPVSEVRRGRPRAMIRGS
jgi:hypothetical protein